MEIFRNIPHDILREHVFPYSYLPQNPKLLNDIRSFVLCRDYLLDLYASNWNKSIYKLWLTKDTLHFFNENVSSIYGFTSNNIVKWKRLYSFYDKSDFIIIQFLVDKYRNPSYHIFKTCLGILTPSERADLLNYVICV